MMISLGDVREVLPALPAESVQMCVTSPPYWGLRDYGVEGQLGLEPTPEEYVANMVAVFREVRRVLRDDGTLWLNLGDSYAHNGPCGGGSPVAMRDHGIDEEPYRMTDRSAQKKMSYAVPPGLKSKDLVGIPWRVAFALQADGWYLRQDIVWHKPNPMPESVTDRCTKAHEYLFLLSKSARYYFDAEAIKEPAQDCGARNRANNKSHTGATGLAPHSGLTGEHLGEDGRNKRSVWTVNSQPYAEAHFATFPPKLIEPCILAGSRPGDTVLDPFFGSGTTGQVCERLGRKWCGIELNPAYGEMAKRRTAQMGLGL